MNWKSVAPLALSIALLGAAVAPAAAQRDTRYDRYDPYARYDRHGYRLDQYGNWVDRNGRYYGTKDTEDAYGTRYDMETWQRMRQGQAPRRWQRQRVRGTRQDWRNDLADRGQEIADRASRLRNQNRLSDRHYDEVLSKLERVRRDVNGTSGETLDQQRYRADMEWMDNIERDMENWSRADRRR